MKIPGARASDWPTHVLTRIRTGFCEDGLGTVKQQQGVKVGAWIFLAPCR